VEGARVPLAAVAAERGEPETWRWAARRCGPCAVQARDLDIIDSSSHYEAPMRLTEPGHHVCRLTAPTMLELEVEVACCSEVEWEESVVFERYRQRLRREGWLMVPPLFSPVLKANYLVSHGAEPGTEALQLEVWTRASHRPAGIVRASASSLLAALEARGQAPAEAEAPQEAWAPPAGTGQEWAPMEPAAAGAAVGEDQVWGQFVQEMPGQQAVPGQAREERVDAWAGFGGEAGPLEPGSGMDDLIDGALGASAGLGAGGEADDQGAGFADGVPGDLR